MEEALAYTIAAILVGLFVSGLDRDWGLDDETCNDMYRAQEDGTFYDKKGDV